MLGSDTQERQRRPGVGAAAILDRVPLPLRTLLDRIEHGILDLAKADLAKADLAKADLAKADLAKADLARTGSAKVEDAGVRDALHALRNALSDICALTEAEAHPTVLRAVERLAVRASGWRRWQAGRTGRERRRALRRYGPSRAWRRPWSVCARAGSP